LKIHPDDETVVVRFHLNHEITRWEVSRWEVE